MAELFNKFEFIAGKGGSIQVLYKNRIYNKCLGIKYKCSSCSSVLSINPTLLTVIKETTLHFGHEELTNCSIDVLKSVEYMKDLAKTDTNNANQCLFCLFILAGIEKNRKTLNVTSLNQINKYFYLIIVILFFNWLKIDKITFYQKKMEYIGRPMTS